MNDHGSRLLEAIMRRTPPPRADDETAAEGSWHRMLAFDAEHL
jgi:hypothetical protein